MRRSVFVLLAIVAIAGPASAHQSSIKYIELTVAGTRVDVAFKVASGDVNEPMKLSPDAKPPPEVVARVAAVPTYVAAWLALSVAGAACPASPATAHVDEDRFIVVTWSVTCPGAVAHLTLDLGRFFAVDKRMEAIVQVRNGDDVTPIVVRAGDSPITLHVGSSSLGRWIRYGMDAFADLDHVAFVLAVLLVVVIRRDPTAWHASRLVPALVATAALIGAFTFAQLVALIVGGSGWVTVSPRLIAALLGASIAYVAAEDIVRPAVRGRLGVVAAFGLVHGIAFATQFRAAGGTTSALAWFALGIVLAQLTLVMIALPLCYLLASVLDGNRYRRLALPILGGAVFALGTSQVIERVFGM